MIEHDKKIKQLLRQEMLDLKWMSFLNVETGFSCSICGRDEYDTFYYDSVGNILGYYSGGCLKQNCWMDDD